MSRRHLIAAAVLAVAAAGVVIALVAGGGGDGGSVPGRAVALATAPDGRAYALIERVEHGRRRLTTGPVADDGTIGTRPVAAPFDHAAALAATRDGTLIVAGDRVTGGRRRLALARLRPDGSADPAFGQNGAVTIDAGDGDAVARGVAAGRGGGIVVAADATRAGRHVLAIARVDARGGAARVDLVPDATAGGAAATPSGEVLVAGTGTRDGAAVLARVRPGAPPLVTRAPTSLSTASWRAVAATGDGGAVVAGSGRDATARSVVAVQRFAPGGTPAGPAGDAAVGEGDAYAAAVSVDGDGRVVVGADGAEGGRPVAFVVTLGPAGAGRAGPQTRGAGRLGGITAEGGVLVTRWDGRRQGVAFVRR